jgi:hypothetical protein
VVHVAGVLQRDQDGRGTRLQAELERSGTRVGQQALLELGIDPGTRDEPRAVGG